MYQFNDFTKYNKTSGTLLLFLYGINKVRAKKKNVIFAKQHILFNTEFMEH